MYDFCQTRKQRPSLIIFGDDNAIRDFVSVRDVVDMIMLLLEKDATVGKVFNCGTGKPARIGDLAKTVIDPCGARGIAPGLQPPGPGPSI